MGAGIKSLDVLGLTVFSRLFSPCSSYTIITHHNQGYFKQELHLPIAFKNDAY